MEKMIGVIAAFSSAVLYSIALGAINQFFWLAIPSLLILCVAILKLNPTRFILWVSVVWVPVVVFVHYIWFFYLLIFQLSSPFGYSIVLYLALSFIHWACFAIYFTMALAVLYFAEKYFNYCYLKACFVAVVFCFSFQVAGFMLMHVLDSGGGYNLLSPMIPFSRCFVGHIENLQSIGKNSPVGQYCCMVKKNKVYLKIHNKKSSRRNLWEVGQELFHALHNLPSGPVLVVTPESFISCPLNREVEFLSFLQRGLGPQQCLMLAGQYEDLDGRVFQAVYSITCAGVVHLYLKQHAVPCIEKMPWYLNTSQQLRKIFKADQTFSYALQKKGAEGFDFEGMRIIPRLCSDFFLVTTPSDLAKLRLSYGENLVVVLHVNDTWFVTYMRELLRYVARMRARLAGVDLVYVGYDGEVCKRI
jgi:hypothetical protein